MSKLTVEQAAFINLRLNELGNVYARENAHGLPVSKSGWVVLESLKELEFNSPLMLNEHCTKFLRQLADIIDEALDPLTFRNMRIGVIPAGYVVTQYEKEADESDDDDD